MCRGRQSHLGGSSSILQHLAAPPIKIPYGSSPPSFRPRALSARRKPLLLLLLLPPLGKTRRNFHSRSKPSPQVVTYEVYGRKKKRKPARSLAACACFPSRLRLRLRRTKKHQSSLLPRSVPSFFCERTGEPLTLRFLALPLLAPIRAPPPLFAWVGGRRRRRAEEDEDERPLARRRSRLGHVTWTRERRTRALCAREKGKEAVRNEDRGGKGGG